jgi:hypothetical protein
MVPGVSAFISTCPDFIPCGEADDLVPFQTHRAHGLPPRIQTNLDENRCHSKCQPQYYYQRGHEHQQHQLTLGHIMRAGGRSPLGGGCRIQCCGRPQWQWKAEVALYRADRTWERGRESSKPRSLYWLLLRGARPTSPGSLEDTDDLPGQKGKGECAALVARGWISWPT